MVKIIRYSEYSKLNEKYIESPENRIKSFFNELEKNIRYWFSEGAFGASGAELENIKRMLSNSIQKNLIFEFNDGENYYQIIIIISLQEVAENKLEDCYIKIKKYDLSSMKLLRSLGEDVSIKDISEDKILELISKLDDVSDTLDLEKEKITLSDDDSDLEDTSIV